MNSVFIHVICVHPRLLCDQLSRKNVIRAVAFAVGIVTIVAIVLASSGQASLYHPEDRTGVVPVDDDGKPEPYPFDELKRRRLDLRNIGNPDWPLEVPDEKEPGKKIKTDRGRMNDRITAEKAKRNRTPVENVALAVDLLRFNRPDDAEGILKGQRSGFLTNITLAHIAVAQGQWARAYEFLDIAIDESVPEAKTLPKELAAMSPQRFAWELKLNKGALKKFIQERLKESRRKSPPEDELPDQIWPEPVKFVNDAGVYEPGVLAASEKAKLGDFTEAIATAQQLVLWFPFDVRLYWLLGELYAAKGDFKSAKDIMDECVNTGKYSNRKVLMEHRDAVTKVANAAAPPPDDVPPDVPFSLRTVWIYFGVVGLIALFALVRAVMKKR